MVSAEEVRNTLMFISVSKLKDLIWKNSLFKEWFLKNSSLSSCAIQLWTWVRLRKVTQKTLHITQTQSTSYILHPEIFLVKNTDKSLTEPSSKIFNEQTLSFPATINSNNMTVWVSAVKLMLMCLKKLFPNGEILRMFTCQIIYEESQLQCETRKSWQTFWQDPEYLER